MSWRSASLGDLCDIEIGKTPSRAEPEYWRDGTLPWLSIADMNQGRELRFTKECVTELGARAARLKLVSPGTLLLSYKLSIGKVGVAQVPMFTNEAIAALSNLSSDMDSGFMYWALQHVDLLQGADRAAMGATLNKAKLRGIMFPVPPIAEQRRIAAILDKADALRVKRRESIAKIDQLSLAIFNDVCGSLLGPPISIGKPDQRDAESYVPLINVAQLATGHTPSRRVPEYWGGDIPWISLADIRRLDGRLAEETEQSTNQSGIANSSAVVLPERTVCFSRTASVGFATILGREMATSQDFVNWICGEELDPFYLMMAFRASKRYLISKSNGSTHKTIYFPVAERFHVFLPEISKQRKFAESLRSVWRLRSSLEKQMSSADNLFESLQARAFTGKL